MTRILISYFTKSGNTEKMARAIAEGAKSVDGVEVELKTIADTSIEDLQQADGIILGSPTYFGQMAAEVKDLIDRSIKVFGRLNGKVGGAFTSSGGPAGGNETTIMGILSGLLVHGMVVQGLQAGSHYGPVAVHAPDDAGLRECQRYGEQTATLTKKLAG